MSKLEPTRTYSNPTATEVLCRMLDERGVEWWQKKRHTCWKVSKGQEVEMWRAWEAPDGSLTLKVDYIYGLTPEQAIAATLGHYNAGRYVVARGEWPYRPESKRHHHAPTVEDVLREFTDAVLEWAGKSGSVAEVGTWSDVAAEYVARLRLAEGEDA